LVHPSAIVASSVGIDYLLVMVGHDARALRGIPGFQVCPLFLQLGAGDSARLCLWGDRFAAIEPGTDHHCHYSGKGVGTRRDLPVRRRTLWDLSRLTYIRSIIAYYGVHRQLAATHHLLFATVIRTLFTYNGTERQVMNSRDFFATHPVFTHAEYLAAREPLGHRSPRTADSLLARGLATGRVLHIRRGLYASIPAGATREAFQVDPFLVATALAPDATVAYHAALQFRGKAYSVWHRFAVLTRHHLRALSFQATEFVGVRPRHALSKGREDLGGGILTEPYAGGTVRITTFERTLVDILDRPDLGGGWEEAWRSLEMVEYFDLDAVVAYARALGSALTTARVGFFLDQHREALSVGDDHLASLRARAPRQPSYLDRTRQPGRLVKPWNLVVPERVLNRTWAEVT
jgi:predicted transcriptional regulator of viral defense system